MSGDLLSIEQKREAIGRGLSQYMNDSSLQNVLSYWEKEYSDQPSFVLNRFLTEVCNTDELRFFKKDILKKVLSELAAVEKAVLMNPSKAISIANPAVTKQTTDAFNYFVKEVCKQVEVKQFDEFDQEVQQTLVKTNIELLVNSKINDSLFLDFISRENYANFITAMYEVFCSYYGPPRADRVYATLKNNIKYDYPNVDINMLL